MRTILSIFNAVALYATWIGCVAALMAGALMVLLALEPA